MKLTFTGQYSRSPRDLIRRCGYGEERKRDGSVSYVKLIRGAAFPRFHAYVEDMDGGFSVNLHLDQKAPTYGANTAHSGEYDGPVVEREGERIRATIESMR